MNHIKKVLNQFGLTDNEATIYLEALKLGETSPYELSRLTQIPRTTVYDILMSLSLKGLITLTQSDGYTKQQTRIKAKNPSEIREIIHKKQQALGALDVAIVDILPELKANYQQQEANANLKFYPGIEGAKKVYFMDYVPNTNQPIVVFENMMPMDAFGREAVNQDVNIGTQKHLKAKSRMRELIPLNDWTKHVITYQAGRDPNYFVARDDRFIENPAFTINERTVIQGSRISITCVKDDEAWGLILNSPSFAGTLTSIFELLWLQATPITPEFVKSLGENLFLKAEISRSQKHK